MCRLLRQQCNLKLLLFFPAYTKVHFQFGFASCFFSSFQPYNQFGSRLIEPSDLYEKLLQDKRFILAFPLEQEEI